MGQLRNRIRVMVARVRAGEGAHVIADLAETTEHWLKSGTVPRPLRPSAERIGTAVGDLGRAYRPPPSDVPPPVGAAEGTPRTARAHEAARPNGHSAEKASKRAKPSEPERPKARASARRSTTKKRAEASTPAAPEPKPQRKTNGKGRTKRPSARRTSGDKTPKPT